MDGKIHINQGTYILIYRDLLARQKILRKIWCKIAHSSKNRKFNRKVNRIWLQLESFSSTMIHNCILFTQILNPITFRPLTNETKIKIIFPKQLHMGMSKSATFTCRRNKEWNFGSVRSLKPSGESTAFSF